MESVESEELYQSLNVEVDEVKGKMKTSESSQKDADQLSREVNLLKVD